jgi:hypothetical protein
MTDIATKTEITIENSLTGEFLILLYGMDSYPYLKKKERRELNQNG